MKFNFQKGWSLTELLCCICIISVCINGITKFCSTNNYVLLSSQIQSILSLSQSLASSHNKSTWLSSENWRQIKIFNNNVNTNIKVHTNGKIKYRGFLSESTIRISALGFTHNNGSFYILPPQIVMVINKALKTKIRQYALKSGKY